MNGILGYFLNIRFINKNGTNSLQLVPFGCVTSTGEVVCINSNRSIKKPYKFLLIARIDHIIVEYVCIR